MMGDDRSRILNCIGLWSELQALCRESAWLLITSSNISLDVKK